jgi:peptide alpha-N-acetyltransferase
MNAPVIEYIDYCDESMLPDIQTLVSKDLSEPYSVFTYRYFVHNWPSLCICVYSSSAPSSSPEAVSSDKDSIPTEKVQERGSDTRKMIGTLVCKADTEYGYMAGYIAMLTVAEGYRHFGIGSTLVNKGIERMIEMGCLEVILETEVTNNAALKLYQKLGFVKEEKMSKYYLNGNDAYRLKLYIDFSKLEDFGNEGKKELEDAAVTDIKVAV